MSPKMLLCSATLFSIAFAGALAGINEDSVKGIARNKFDFIRIKVHYLQDHAEIVELLDGTSKILGIIQDAMKKAVNIIQNTIKVERMLNPLLISRPCKTLDEKRYLKKCFGKHRKYCEKGCYENVTCLNFTLPYSHLDDCYVNGKGPLVMKHGAGQNNTDLVAYVAVVRNGTISNTSIAGAASCVLEPIAKDRPIAGIIVLRTDVFGRLVNIQQPHGYHVYVSTLVHEFIHMLGFANIAMPFFRIPKTGKPLTQRSSGFPYLPKLGSFADFTNISIFDGLNYVYKPNPRILTMHQDGFKWKGNNLVQAAAAYYNCNSLASVNIDYVTSHNSPNTQIGDTMGPVVGEVIIPSGKISSLTAAFLKDTGWYKIVGRRVSRWQGATGFLGCEFAKNGCKNHKGWPCCSREFHHDVKCAKELTAKGICLRLEPYSDQSLYRVRYLNKTMKDDLWKYMAPFCRYPSWQPQAENNVLWEQVDKDTGYCFNYARGRTKIDKSKLPPTLKPGWQQKYFNGKQQLSGCYKVNCAVANGYNVSSAFGPPQFCREDGKSVLTFEHAGKKIGPFGCWEKAVICWKKSKSA